MSWFDVWMRLDVCPEDDHSPPTPQVNTNGPLVLFQATYTLLQKSAKPKFIVVSSGMGSITIGANLPVNTYAYGASKAAVNWVTRKLHHDFPDFSKLMLG